LTSSDAHSDAPRKQKLLYGRRKGPKLSAYQAGLLERLLPRIALTPQSGIDPKAWFSPGAVREIWLEIGFGAGEHLAAQAAANTEIGLIGVEPYIAGMAKLLVRLAAQQLHNVRVYQSDARDIVDALPDASLDRVFVLFPDPWPKKRHHKRRFISVETLDRLARVMRPGAELRFATDDPGYLVWALERLTAHSCFRWRAEGPADWRTRPADWPETRYEAKAKQADRVCTYLRFVRLEGPLHGSGSGSDDSHPIDDDMQDDRNNG
jgi:tRNA (guanine-N7-)-methyltransferase